MRPRPLITGHIDESRRLTLAGNTRRGASRQNDRGPVEDGLHLDMYLQLKRSPELELAARQFVESLSDRTSPNFHKWISAREYGERFGAAPEDIAIVSQWLETHGFTVNNVPAHRMVIDFSGNAGQVRAALHTEIHHLEVAGKPYFANMSDPQIPAALAPAVEGVVSLSNFMPHPMLVPKREYTVSSRTFEVVPGDLATIYNLSPAFAGGFTGLGQTIVVVEDSDLYKTDDWQTFRKTFGLDQYTSGTLAQVHPAPGQGGACTDPGVGGADIEAAVDAEWASAAAPNAAIVVAACADTTNFGGFIALQNLLTNGGPLPGVVSISYGESETETGAAQNSYINTLYQTAAAAGVSVFVSSGDAAATGNDRDEDVAIHGVNVSGWAGTVYNVSVGGTDFGDYAAGQTASFWNPVNGPYFDSAMSYVPEIPWNDSCGSQVLANYYGFSTVYGLTGVCNSLYRWLDTDGGSGGPSGCATGAPSLPGVVSGTCAGYPKPSWQSVFGNPGDGVRDQPDLSLFAASGVWGHYYVLCSSDWAPCTGSPSNWPGAGGTSFSSPIMAGIQTLINQALATSNIGNPNPVYYQIAQNQYNTAGGLAKCNSTAGPASTCSFIDITQGDIVVPCAGQFECYAAGGGLGVLSTSSTAYAPAFAAAPGWDFATGLGSVNAFNLLNAFVGAIPPTGKPAAPVLVSPANGAVNVSLAPTFTWNAAAVATSYDVYFGAASTPPLVTNIADLNYAPGPLSSGTTYYWAIGARNSLGTNVSAAWSFTTSCVQALNPSSATAPAAGATGTIPVNAGASCNWTAVSNATWITITSGSSGSGNGTVGYTVASDPGALRTGTISIAGQIFTVTQAGIFPLISTLAGGGLPATQAPGTSFSIPLSNGIAVDSAGNVYFSSPTLNAVLKMDPTGMVTRVAGTGVSGQAGDSGPALSAQLYNPSGVAVDSAGNLYIADTGNGRIRKVDNLGTITTVAGNGCCYGGDGGPAAAAQLDGPYGVAVDSSGNLYIADTYNSRIRKVTTTGTITTVAGNGTSGYSGDGGPAAAAELRYPFAVIVDGSGDLLIADTDNYRVRKVDTSGNITTVAGNGTCCYSGDGGQAINARLSLPYGLALDASGNLYIADASNSRVRKVSASGAINTVAGNGVSGFYGDGGPAIAAQFRNPEGVAVDGSGNLYIADTGNMRIRGVSGSTVTTLAGGAVGDGGLAVFAFFNQPSGVARDSAGNTYVADSYNNLVRKVGPGGSIGTVVGTGVAGYSGDGGAASNAQLNAPQGLALDAAGNLFIADSANHRVRRVDGSGRITTVAGNGLGSYGGDNNAATLAPIGTPYGLALDSIGNLYISDVTNNVVRKVDSSGVIGTAAGSGGYGYSGDGGPATQSKLYGPYGVAVDSSGNLYIADRYNYRVRMVSNGTITTVAGTGTCCYNGDGPATKSELDDPSGVAVDAAGNLYIADTYNERVRVVLAGGNIVTVAGTGAYGYSGDGGSAAGAAFRLPYALVLDASGNIVVSDQSNNAVRLMTPVYSTPVLGIKSSHTGPFTQGQSGAAYTLTVSNAPQAGSTNGAVTVTEILPAGMTLVSMGGPGWNCSAPAAPTCTRSDALNAGSSYSPITVTVSVSGSAPGQLTNQASVSGGGGAVAGVEDLTIVGPGGGQAPGGR